MTRKKTVITSPTRKFGMASGSFKQLDMINDGCLSKDDSWSKPSTQGRLVPAFALTAFGSLVGDSPIMEDVLQYSKRNIHKIQMLNNKNTHTHTHRLSSCGLTLSMSSA